MNSIELRAQRAELVKNTQDWYSKIEAEGRELTADDETEWSNRMAEIDRLESEAKKAERKEVLAARSEELAQPAPRKTTNPARPNITDLRPSKQERNKLFKHW